MWFYLTSVTTVMLSSLLKVEAKAAWRKLFMPNEDKKDFNCAIKEHLVLTSPLLTSYSGTPLEAGPINQPKNRKDHAAPQNHSTKLSAGTF